MSSRTAAVLTLVAVLIGVLLFSSLTAGESDSVSINNYRVQSQKGTPPFPVVERAAKAIRGAEGWEAGVGFLTDHVQLFPEDPNNSYYLTLVGELYDADGARRVSRQYYRRALLSHPDVVVREISTHRVALMRLLEIVDAPSERIGYLRRLQRDFQDSVDPGLVAYYLAAAYEREGRWDEAYTQYATFLAHPETRIPGEPEAHNLVARRLAFYRSSRDWTHRDLDELVQIIKGALWAQDARRLLRYRAGVNFFTMSWEQEAGDANSEIPSFDIAAFVRRSRVRYAQDLEISSNSSEAYLRTWGWSHRIPTWYLYFRRVDFPADPDVHGTWEWAGIFFGESL